MGLMVHMCVLLCVLKTKLASKAQAAQALVLPSQVATPGEISLKSLA